MPRSMYHSQEIFVLYPYPTYELNTKYSLGVQAATIEILIADIPRTMLSLISNMEWKLMVGVEIFLLVPIPNIIYCISQNIAVSREINSEMFSLSCLEFGLFILEVTLKIYDSLLLINQRQLIIILDIIMKFTSIFTHIF